MISVWFILVFSLACRTKDVILSSDIEVELDYRTLEPGEVIAVEIKNPADVLEAKVKFLNSSFRMGTSETSRRMFGFLSLELELEPGFYPLTVFIKRSKGHWEKVQKRIIVPGKEFPVNKLWVDERFLTPPKRFWERIEWESELLNVLFNVYTPRWFGEGGFVFPSAGNARPSFGERRLFNNFHWSTHRGVDVGSPFGSPVIASNSGKIVLARNLYYAGNAVIIDHGIGVFTFYCHLSKFSVQRGDFVRKGDIIGQVGSTGRVTGPHLHWAVMVAGKSVDPYSLLNLNLE